MLEWLKTILGDAYTDEIDKAVTQEIKKGYAPQADLDAKDRKVKELETQVGQLEESAKTHAASLADLKKLVGDKETLEKKIGELEEQAKTDKAAYEKELAQVKLLSAVDAELTAAGSRNNTAVRAVLADFLTSAKIDGEAATLAGRIEALKKDASTDFLFGKVEREGWKAGESGGGGKPDGNKKPSEMSYAELSAYLAEHPDTKL